MKNLNRVCLCGFLGADAEKKQLPRGGVVTNLRLATSEPSRMAGGGEVTDWHYVVAWDQLGTRVGDLKKGDPVLVTGSLKTRSWEKDGQKHYRTEVVADLVEKIVFDSPANKTPQPLPADDKLPF